jgi:hypothetical protein
MQALETLCSVAGGVLAERARADLDAAVASAASFYVVAGASDARCAASAAERRAAYSCLLASVLAPRPRRAPHLPLALSLFRRGAEDPDTSEFCGRALLALEAVIHPVATPRAQPRDMAEPSRQANGDAQAQASTQVLSFGMPATAMPRAPFAAALPTAAAPRPLAQPAAFAAAAPAPMAFGQQPPAAAPAAPAPVMPAAGGLGFSAQPEASVAAGTQQPAAVPAARAAPVAPERAALPIPLPRPGAPVTQADAAMSSDSEGPLPELVFHA